MPTWSATLIGLSTVVLAVAISVPQLVRTARTGAVSGVSLAAVANSTVSFGAWTVYAVGLGDLWLIASSAVGLPGQLALTWLVWRRGGDRAHLWLPGVWLALLGAVAATDVLLGTGLAHLVVGASVLWLVIPAVLHAWRSSDVSGIAAGSWWVLSAEGALFLGYGLVAGVPATVVYGVACLAGSSGVLGRLAVAREAGQLAAAHA